MSDKLIQTANARLKAGKAGVAIETKGDHLTLRATLPPKPNSGRDKPYQQRIYLGWYANPAGIKRAEAEALRVCSDLAQDKFDWANYREPEQQPRLEIPIISDLIEKFKADKLAQGISDRTWRDDYAEVFDKLPQDSELSSDIILELVRGTEPNTRTRRRYCLALSALAKFASFDIDLSQYVGNYSPSKVQPRDIPPDESIQQWYSQIPNPSWQWAFGVLATYGIRPGELLTLDFDDFPILNVTGGKT